MNEKIHCTVGILTFNSEKNLRRALYSVRDFSDIVISDGGSGDRTLSIASDYNCRVVEQYSKTSPGPDPSHPINDFAKERNILLKEAREDWFLYIDSDEYISSELRDEIKKIVEHKANKFLAYEIPIGNQSPDATVTYKPWKQNYQIRFFNKRIGGTFKKIMHERYVFDREQYPVGRLKGKWYVPFSKPDFKSYSKAVNYRLRIMLKGHPPLNFFDYLEQGIALPVKRVVGATYRMIMMRIFYSWREVLPMWQYRNMCYSHWVTFRVVTKLYIEQLFKE